MKIVSADFSAAILDQQYKPLSLVASALVLVTSPYREQSFRLAEPIFRKVEHGFDVIMQ